MKTPIISQLANKYSVSVIEKHLIMHYLRTNNVSYQQNQFISDYLADFKEEDAVLDEIAELNHNSIEELVSDMELLIPTSDKGVNGAFFTPSYIVDYIISTVAPTKTERVADLSCGSGAFLLGIVKYFTSKYGISVKQCVKNNLLGADILPYNVRRSKTLIIIYALSLGETINETEINITHCDSLSNKWNDKIDVVVGNPPYVKFQDMDDNTRQFLLENYSSTNFGTFNLYFAFFELGYRLLSNKGRLGYITPNNYFTSLSGECLRQYFQNTNAIYQIVDFAATKVFDVQTYTAITFLNKKSNKSIDYARIEDGERPQSFIKTASFTSNLYSQLNVSKWRLLCGNERYNIERIELYHDKLGSLVNVCVGIATLKDEAYFVIPVAEDEKYYTIEKNGNTYKVEKEVTLPLVKISEMKTQSDIDCNQRRIIFPYYVKNGSASIIEEERFKQDYPCCYEYLLSAKDILAKRGKGKHIYTPFYSYGRTQGLNRFGAKLLTPTFSKHPRFVFDKNINSLFTNGYGIYANSKNNGDLFAHPFSKEENFDVLQKVLNSVVMDYYVKKTSVSIEGGYPCYQKNFIERFSFPMFEQSEIDEIRQLSSVTEIDKYLISKYQLKF